MSKLGWVCAIFGWAIAGVIAFAIIFDIGQAETSKTTISHWCLVTAREYPWLPVVLSAPVFLILGILIGHLWFPQYLPK